MPIPGAYIGVVLQTNKLADASVGVDTAGSVYGVLIATIEVKDIYNENPITSS